jgi:hypothetical protein
LGLHPYLAFCVVFSALAMVVAGGGGGRLDKALPAALIAIEVSLLLVARDLLNVPGLSDGEAGRYGAVVATLIAITEFLRREDRTFPLLAFFAALTQCLVALGVIT